ncbi:uncharacterized protein F4822DRAFT_154905 [Hypoxylon trugodes]|uniref:uncharacterized protein n=1 Tax=Hypoxylon trugodes TaxID=326681 RepID=UPI0021979591|nr:uncharacterized protein F4822DRAFT_154905 [Hypoxylon trugodes]KAI1390574.1 hypothetical protein F4822DRAFT_154905 [Hypoxylon trugodes]
MDSDRLKQLEKAEAELHRRRERGRLAQRAFRKRHGKATQDKHTETQKLKAAIEEIVRVVRRDDRPELIRAVREAAEMTGSDVQISDDSPGTTERATMRPALPLHNLGDLVPLIADPPPGLTASTQGKVAFKNNWLNWNLNYPVSTTSGAKLDSAQTSTRPGYGNWFETDRYIRNDSPPLDIIPYLGTGMTTFAGRLFWASGEYLLHLCWQAEANEKINPRVAREANERIWNMIRHSQPLHNVRYIIALAEARREFRDRGFIEGNNPAGEADSGCLLNEHVVADYKARGEDPAGWLSPIAVEQELRKRLSQESYKQFETALERWGSNEAEGPVAEVVQSLIQNLVTSFVCFGDGPRWHTDFVAALFGGHVRVTAA